jgi:three-Cys-motif partner protein
MGKNKKSFEQEECLPFDFLPEVKSPGIKITLNPLRYPIWTEHKAKLIQQYLYLFVLVTRHGTYIDGFAGPQELDKPDMWAAKLVLEREPRFLRHFYLFDKSRKQYKALLQLKAEQPERNNKNRKLYRKIEVFKGDFNALVGELLSSNKIKKDTEATFCLLDQRTFECHWATVKAIAEYKSTRKIEIFYFLAVAWLDRALANQKEEQVIADWWGRDDWPALREMSMQQRVDAFIDRFKDELGYMSVMAWPIFQKEGGGGTTMYYMIHATDHPDAPGLMYRAYHDAIKPKKPTREVQMEFADLIREFGGELNDTPHSMEPKDLNS